MRYCQSKPFGYQYLDDALNMPEEYQGVLVSNAETTDDAYAFLVLYRCKKYGVGCATGAPTPPVTGLTAVGARPSGSLKDGSGRHDVVPCRQGPVCD